MRAEARRSSVDEARDERGGTGSGQPRGNRAGNGEAVGAASSGRVVVTSGADWHGRYGRRPNPRFKSEEARFPYNCRTRP
jgi:hypothetical protein